jgi:Kef-type K+ transport system membrane component KefB
VSKSFLLYPLILLAFALGMFIAIERGSVLNTPRNTQHATLPPPAALQPSTGVGPSASLLANLRQNFEDPLTRLFVQLILIVLAARVCGSLMRKAGQPAVIGEMIAGILLGPSLMGWLWPGFFQMVFPPASLGTLRMLSQIGVCLFMFVIGMELDVAQLKQQARTAVFVSQVSILFPYLLGVLSALWLFPSLAAPGTTFLAFALFIGISMSITAFPVLARILEERGLTKTALGSTALACAATDDVTAWTVLAFVVAIVKAGGLAPAVLSIVLVLLFVAVMLFWIKPRVPHWLSYLAPPPGSSPSPATKERERAGERVVLFDGISRRLQTEATSSPQPSPPFHGGEGVLPEVSRGRGQDATVMVAVIVFLFACAFVTDMIGIHALFGSFLAGIAMPSRGEFRNSLRVRLEHFSSVFLLPLFFAFTGLRTQIGLLQAPAGWLICLALVAVATLGKLGGSMLAARMTGINWVDSFALGALMNTRGLVELIALNIGYDLGILSPPIFTMLVLMALVTTGMTGPLLGFGDHLRARHALRTRLI